MCCLLKSQKGEPILGLSQGSAFPVGCSVILCKASWTLLHKRLTGCAADALSNGSPYPLLFWGTLCREACPYALRGLGKNPQQPTSLKALTCRIIPGELCGLFSVCLLPCHPFSRLPFSTISVPPVRIAVSRAYYRGDSGARSTALRFHRFRYQPMAPPISLKPSLPRQ